MPDDLEPGWGFLSWLQWPLRLIAWLRNLTHPDSEES
jgi:hypothetical protein